MASDLLTSLVSTGVSESTFSTCGRMLDDRRSNLVRKTLNRLMCLQDWEVVDRHTQHHWHNELVKEMSFEYRTSYN